MKLLADENIPIVLVHRLRENGHEIISVTESYQGYTDKKLLKIAQKKKCYILTFDKDFGELVFKLKLKVEGIILLRFPPCSVDYISNIIQGIISILESNPGNNFIVVDEEKVRIRKLKINS